MPLLEQSLLRPESANYTGNHRRVAHTQDRARPLDRKEPVV